MGASSNADLRDRLRLAPGPVDLTTYDPRATPGAPGGKKRTKSSMADDGDRLADLQDRLYAEAAGGGARSVLLVLQGMDTSGKGGVIKHVVGMVNPQGVSIVSFKAPTAAELDHHFLWRIRRAVPAAGMIGVFDRSHYEDVLITRVRNLVPVDVVDGRYAEINRFEAKLGAAGVRVVKCFLHISPQRQRDRLAARLDDPTKLWKFSPGDIDERRRWPDYQAAYEVALARCSTDTAPWYIVPSDRKWYRNWAVATLLAETLADLDPHYPPMAFDVEAQRARLAAS